VTPKVSQTHSKDFPKAWQKATQEPPRQTKKIGTLSKLGFVDRRNVFELPKPKVDYAYYVVVTLETLLFMTNETLPLPCFQSLQENLS